MELSTVLRQKCWKYAPDHVGVAHVVFTDQPAPKDVRKYDVSDAKDKGVVRWRDGDTYYFSTQRPGVKVVAPQHCDQLFQGCISMQSIDGSMLDVSNVQDMGWMFCHCCSLEDIDSLADWDVGQVRHMESVFYNCFALRNVDALQNWNIHNVNWMGGMFISCSLENTDAIARWDVSNVKHMDGMFCHCESLENVDALAQWNVDQRCTTQHMFDGCPIRTTIPSWYHDYDDED
jgi:surface protein